MSYTNIDLVKHYLEVSYPLQSKVNNQALVLEGNDYLTFYGGEIDEASFIVKSIRSSNLNQQLVTFDSTAVLISSAPLIPGSVVIASDSSLGKVYVENMDYVVDYNEGKVIIKDGGSLTISMTVNVWYQVYYVYIAGSDYKVDASQGSIKRTSTGNIALWETVYLDYIPIYKSYTEEILNNAVVEANSLIEKTVDTDKQFGADLVLQAAATYRAVEIVCRTSAVRELSHLKSNDRTALAWMKLADYFAEQSKTLLESFRPPFNNFSTPKLS